MFKYALHLQRPQTCIYCGRIIHRGEKALCHITLLGRKYSHISCQNQIKTFLAFMGSIYKFS